MSHREVTGGTRILRELRAFSFEHLCQAAKQENKYDRMQLRAPRFSPLLYSTGGGGRVKVQFMPRLDNKGVV